MRRLLPTMPQSKYDSYGGSSSGSSGDDEYENQITLKLTPHASLNSNLTKLFGNQTEWGTESLGLVLSDVELIDGGLYYDMDKDTYKLFSVKEAAGLSQADAEQRGMDLDVDDFDDVLTKTYFGEQKTYDLLAARVEASDDIEATSKVRELEPTGGDGLEFTDYEYLDGEVPEVADETLTWLDGSEDYGPSATSKGIAETLSEYGEDLITSEESIRSWLADTTGDNILREDLVDRRVEFFLVTRESENGFNYFSPVFIDDATGERIPPANSGSGGSGNESAGSDGNTSTPSAEPVRDSGGYPEPIADFIRSAGNLELTPDRAGELLDDMVDDPDTALTDGHIEDAGGRGAVIQEVV